MKQKLSLYLFFIFAHTISPGYAQEVVADSLKAQQLRSKIQKGQNEISSYNTACYFALSGDKTFAFSYLKAAVYIDGFSSVNDFQDDSDLASLHADPQWNVLLKAVADNEHKMKKNAELLVAKPGFWNSKTLETTYKENISADEKIAGLSRFWSDAKYNFANFDLVPHLNFDSLYFAYLPKVRETKSTLEYYKVMAEFGAQLKDAHTAVLPPEVLMNKTFARPLLRSRLIEDKILIVGIYDAALSRQGIKVGQEIIAVNGLPVKEYASKYITPYRSSSTPQDQETRAYEYSLLLGPINKPVRLQLKDESGKIETFTVTRVKGEDRAAKMTPPAFEYKLLKGNVAYIALNSFSTDSAAKAFAGNYAAISKASAIIFDVRDNGGGSGPVGWEILSYLINQPVPIASLYVRTYNPYYRAANLSQKLSNENIILKPNGKFYYRKPVIILTGSKTFSAAEDFTAAFKSLNRGLIIGKPTGGSTGLPLIINLPGNLTAEICTVHDRLANGDEFIGIGIQPDKLVTQTVADFRKGIDTQLEAAITELTK